MARLRFARVAALLVGACVLAAGTALPSQAAGHKHSAHHKHSHKSGHKHHYKHSHRSHHKKRAVKKQAVEPAAAPVSSPVPTNAAKIFRWGNAQLKDEFHGALASNWAVNPAGAGLVRNQNGMLTLNTTATSGTVTADWQAGARQYGRWEARVRTRQYGTSATPYRAVWELVPTTGEDCARGIVLSESTIGQNPATMHLRNADVDFSATKVLDLRQDAFHTYAVEVTPDHISWFIDTRVVMTETRSAARTGAAYTVRFRMVAPVGAQMNKGRMQMDWVRYYTLERKNAQSIAAPGATLTSYDGGC